MTVKELKSGCGSAVVELMYGEIRDLANLLYKEREQLHKQQEKGRYTDNIEELELEFNALQELTKGGGLQIIVTRYNIEEVMSRKKKTSPEPHEGE